MAEYALKDYVSLITKLLQCSEGEEWALFHRYSHLVNIELVQVLEQIARNFIRQGDSRTASFLQNWAVEIQSQLKQKAVHEPEQLTQDAHYELIQLLLDCPRSHVNTILNQKRSMIDENLVRRMESVAEQMATDGDSQQAQFLIDLATQIHQKLSQWETSEPAFIPPHVQTQIDPSDANLAVDANLTAKESPPVSSCADNETLQPDTKMSSVCYKLESLVLSISKLAEAIATQSNHAQPLSYLETLEKAQANAWLLTTHEVGMILGAKPHCSSSSIEYLRGGWRFVKCGKVGRDLLWQVFKIDPSDANLTENHSSAAFEPSLSLPTMEPDPWLA